MTSNLNLTTCSARGGLIVGFLLAATVLPVGATLSATPASYGTTTSGSWPRPETDIAGQVVTQSSTGESSHTPPPSFDKVVLGTASGSASASVDYGVSRIALTTGVVDLRSQAPTNAFNYKRGYTGGGARAEWNDRWSIGGGAPGDLVSISLSGRTTYRFALTGIAGITDARAFSVNQWVNVSTSRDRASVLLDTADFMNSAGLGFIDWSLTVVGAVDEPVQISSSFGAGSNCCYDLLLGTQDYEVTYSFDSMNTSRLQRIELPSGYSLTADSGEIVAHDGAFAYRAALVPEPQTWALLVFGLGVLGWRAARRQA